MRIYKLFSIVFAMLLFTTPSWAQGTIMHTTAPAPGTNSGTIYVEGKVTADTGWTLTGGVIVTVWEDDGELINPTTVDLTGDLCFPNITYWSSTISGLTSSTSYNVTVEATLTNGCDTVTIKTALATATAK